MDVDLVALTDLDESLALAPLIDRHAAEMLSQYTDDPLPEGIGERFLRGRLDHPQTLVLLARGEGDGEPLGLCVTGPFEDPLLGTTLPMVVVLHVDADHRHRGLARHLVEETRRILAGRGETRLLARAPHNDDALISMGERWGMIRHWELMVLE